MGSDGTDAAFGPGVELDTTGEPWVGTFAGLGTVRVHADGSVDVDPVGSADAGAADALRYGWGVPLAHLRAGRRLVCGGGVVDSDGRCLVFHGPPEESGRMLMAFVDAGWEVMSDRVQALEFVDDEVLAHPGAGPVLAHRGVASAVRPVGDPVRPGSDVVAVDTARAQRCLPVGGLVQVTARRSNRPSFTVLTGHRRFDACTNLAGGDLVVSAGMDLGDHMGRALLLATLPHCRVAFDRFDTVDLGDVVDWWSTARAASTRGPHR